jgi:hypothetical protein
MPKYVSVQSFREKSPWITDLIVVKNFQKPRGYFRLLQDQTSRTRGKTVAGTDSPVFPVGTSVNFLGIFRRSVDVTSKNFVCSFCILQNNFKKQFVQFL